LKKSCLRFNLNEDAYEYLDSIAFQLKEENYKEKDIKKAAYNICKIASRYDWSFEVTRMFDGIMPDCLKNIRKIREKYSVTFEILDRIEELNEEESEISQSNKLSLRGLQSRIEEYMFKLNNDGIRGRLATSSKKSLGDPSPWRENAVRALEGD